MEDSCSSTNLPEKVTCKVRFLRFIKNSGRILKLIILYPFNRRMFYYKRDVINNININIDGLDSVNDVSDENVKCSFKLCRKSPKSNLYTRLNNNLYDRSNSISTDESIGNKDESGKNRNVERTKISIASNINGRQMFNGCNINDFEIGETIGTGSYATVCIAKYNNSSKINKNSAVSGMNSNTGRALLPNNTTLYSSGNDTDKLGQIDQSRAAGEELDSPGSERHKRERVADEEEISINEQVELEIMDKIDDLRVLDPDNIDDRDKTEVVEEVENANELQTLVMKNEEGNIGDQNDVSRTVALKILNKAKIVTNKQIAHVKNESDILGFVKHPFIVGYLGRFQDCHNLYFVLEFLGGGELFSYLRKYGRFSMKTVQFYTSQVLLALEYLHHNGVVYRDLKPENIILDFMGYIRLVDFGFAKVIESEGRTWTVCGTCEYLAPEIFLKKGHGFQVDFYSLGVLLYELLVGVPPFYSSDPQVTYKLVLDHQIKFPKYLCKSSRDIIKKLLEINPEKRLGNNINEVYLHDFFGGLDFNKILLKAQDCPILPPYRANDDVSNFIKYPKIWKNHKENLTVEQQDLFEFF